MSVIYSTLLTNAVNNLIASEQEPMNIFINHSDSLVRTVSEIFSQNQVKLNSFDEPLRDSITITITISLQTLIKKLTDYIQQGEKSPCMFNPHAKERAVEYLQEFINGKPVTDFSEKINELLESFERYDTTTNRIDWHKIVKIIDAFKKIQKSSKIYA